MLESGPIVGYDSHVIGTNDYKDSAGSDIVVITAGVARKPGMSRDDLLKTNMNIVGECTKKAVAHSPECILIIVSSQSGGSIRSVSLGEHWGSHS
jgi:malate dehydrogenase